MKKLNLKDPETQSADMVGHNIEQLKELFPEAFSEGRINFGVLKQLLGGSVDDGEEKYGLNWHGKRRARQIALTPSTGTLRPCPADSVDWDTTQNLMIEGDNLEVLKLLQKSYAGKVKLIYIDPPYNTGNDFVYPDNFQDNIANYLRLTGQIGVDGKQLSSNPEASGRFHTAWLNMMYPRLKLARNLLREDGIIFVSIDENEMVNLRLIASEIFGEENFEATVIPIANPGGRDYKEIAITHEYLVIFSKSEAYQLNELEKEVDFSLQDTRGGYELRELRNRNPRFTSANRPNLFYPFYVNPGLCVDGCCAVSTEKTSDYSIEVRPYNSQGDESVWRWGRPKSKAAIIVGDIQRSDVVARKKSDGKWNVYEKCRRSTTKAKSVWNETSMRTEDGTRMVRELMGATVFNHPKSVELIKKCILLSSSEHGDIVMDFFAGSGTSGHAVLAQNAADSIARRFILIQLPEQLDPQNKDQVTATNYCDKLGKPHTVAELTKERLRRAAKKIKEENPLFAGDLGFRVFKLDSSNIQAWEPEREDLDQALDDHAHNIKAGRTEQDILCELLLKLGLDLTVPIENKKITGKVVHSIGAGTLFVCLTDKVARKDIEPLAEGIVAWRKSLAPAGDSQIVFRDSAFEDDVAKTNLTAILQQNGLDNVRSI